MVWRLLIGVKLLKPIYKKFFSLFSYFKILFVMTAVTFPLRPPRLAFAICGRRWQNDVYENKV